MIQLLKWQVALTKCCIDLNNALDQDDIARIRYHKNLWAQIGYPFPAWVDLWLEWLEENPLKTAEEHHKYSTPKFPGFHGMNEGANRNVLNRLEEHMLEVALHEAECDTHPAKMNAAFTIAHAILSNSSGSDGAHDGGLSYEWHCRAYNFSHSIAHPHGYKIFVDILQRETAFWQGHIKIAKNPPSIAALQPASAPTP